MPDMEKKSHFAKVMESNPPRLVVLFRMTDNGEEFQWGIVGDVPIMTLIGGIVDGQSKVMYGHRSMIQCDESAFVMTIEDGVLSYFIHQDIPKIPLLGMLETVKSAIIGGMVAQKAAAQRTQIVGPDGNPVKRL